jgi:chitodextrinase
MYKERFKILKICIFTLLSVILSFRVVEAGIYYVSPSGNDNNNGSASAPFKTIQKAANIVNPGDTVIVKDGVYTVSPTTSNLVDIKRGGTADAWVTFKAENRWKAVIDGLNDDHNGVMITSPYVIFDGFEIKNIYWQGIIVQADNIIIRNNYIHNIGNWYATSDTNSATSGIIPDGDNIIIEGNLFHSIGKTGWSSQYNPGKYDHAVYGTYVNNLKIINNIIYDVWTGKAIDFAATNGIVANNTILRLTEPPSGQPTDSGLMAITGGNNQIIQNNIFYGCNGQPPIKTYSALSYSLAVNNNLTSPDCPPLNSMANRTGVTFSGNIENKEPLFIDISKRDFHLLSGSPAIDKGKSYPERIKDADGNPINGLPDIGAFEYSNTTSPIPTGDTTPPSIPANLSAVAVSPSQINLSWSASIDNIGINGYKIYRCQGNDCTPTTLIATTTSTSYQNTGLTANTTYTYAVSAYDAAGNESAKSGSITATTPSNSSMNTITVRAKGSFAGGEWPIMGIWIDGSEINSVTVSSTSYQDFTFTFNGNITNTVDIVFNNDYYDSTTGNDRNLWVDYIIVNNQKYEAEAPSTTYDRGYGSAAFDGLNVIPGQEAMLWNGALRFKLVTLQSLDAVAPSAPSNLKAGAITSSTIVLSWSPSTDNTGVAGYRIYRDGSQIATTSSTAFKDRNLSPSTVYTYTIIAYNVNEVTSQLSNTISVKTLASRK